MPGRHTTALSTSAAAGRRSVVLAIFLSLVGALLVTLPPQQAHAACSGNAIKCENELPGTPQSEWDIDGIGDASIQGFATQISVNAGSADPVQGRHQCFGVLDQDLSTRLVPRQWRERDRHDLAISLAASEPASVCDRPGHRDLRLRNLEGLRVVERSRGTRFPVCTSRV